MANAYLQEGQFGDDQVLGEAATRDMHRQHFINDARPVSRVG
jgi:hypothetical protein